MPSEHRLHPTSLLFGIGKQLRGLALPGALLLVTAGSVGLGWQMWGTLFGLPFALISLVRYFSFRYRYEPNEMVVRWGFLFRNERHIPYARIQNLDAVQNVLHRALRVVEVRVQTGAGEEPEATLSVLPVAAYEEMRRRVFEPRASAPTAMDPGAGSPARSRVLLHLPPRELVLYGLLENRGAVILAAAFGIIWELGLLNALFGRIFGEQVSGRGAVRAVLRSLFGLHRMPLTQILLGLAAVVAVLLLLRVLSTAWSVVRLYGFRLTRDGEDLRTELGLLTRITATIPRRRIQTLTIREGPLYRLFGRASVRVETAGGGGGEGRKTQREWLAPILRRAALSAFVGEVMPELSLAAVAWNAADPRAFRRALKTRLLMAFVPPLALVMILKWWSLALLVPLVAWAFVAARLYVNHLGWAVTDGAILFRSGWYRKELSAARFNKIQTVTIHESPFDRRAVMARVRVDTAGARELSHRVDIPYLSRQAARDLYDLLAAQAARTAFRW